MAVFTTSLQFVFDDFVITLPIIISYTVCVYKVFSSKTKPLNDAEKQ